MWNVQTLLNKRIWSLTRIMNRFVFSTVLSDGECCFIEWLLLMSIVYIEWNSLKKAFTRVYSNWMHYSGLMICLTNAFNEGTLIIIQIMALSQSGLALRAIFGCRMTLSLQEEVSCVDTEKLSTAFRQHLHLHD